MSLTVLRKSNKVFCAGWSSSSSCRVFTVLHGRKAVTKPKTQSVSVDLQQAVWTASATERAVSEKWILVSKELCHRPITVLNIGPGQARPRPLDAHSYEEGALCSCGCS